MNSSSLMQMSDRAIPSGRYRTLLHACSGGVCLLLPSISGPAWPGDRWKYQVYRLRDCKLSPRTIEGQTAALRFLFVKTLGRAYTAEQIPFPKCHKRLPTVLSQQEVARLIDAATT